MSGTPMKDSFAEIGTVLNLILPISLQLPKKQTDFIEDYFTLLDDKTYIIKDDKVVELKSRMKGRVSFLKPMIENIKVIFEGEKNIGTLQHFMVKVIP